MTVPPPSDVAVHTIGLTKRYGTSAAPVVALAGIDLTIRTGERVALLGKSGSGKSTLLGLLGGLDRPTAGAVWVGGRDLAAMSSADLARHRLRTTGVIFQAYHLIPSLSALQNVELPMVFAGTTPRQRRATAARMLGAVELGHRMHHRPVELSGGERQRVALARALVNEPAVLLADEPTGNLDTVTAGSMMQLMLDLLAARGATLLLVTHDLDLATRSSDRILRMADGRIVS